MYILPNTTETHRFTELMQDYWSEISWPLPGIGGGPFQPIGFIFLDTEEELLAIYADKELAIPVELAIIFDGDPFVNMLVLNMNEYFNYFPENFKIIWKCRLGLIQFGTIQI